MTYSCLLIIYGQQNIIPAIAAIKHYAIVKNRIQKPKVKTVLFFPGLADERLEEVKPFIDHILEYQGWDPLIIIKRQELPFLLESTYILDEPKLLATFKNIIELDNVEEIYYPHEHIGQLINICRVCYPNADNITFGDAFGSILDRKEFDFSDGKIAGKKNLISSIQSYGKNFIYNRKFKTSNIKIVAILPADWYGGNISNKNLYVVPRITALMVIHECLESIYDIKDTCNSFFSKIREPIYLLVLSNFSDCNYLTDNAEIDFYENLVKSVAVKKSSIIIKSHPLSIKTDLQKLCKRLESDYHVFKLPSQLNQIPVEILFPLIENCEIIAFSSSILSISYLFDKKVIFPINEEMIEQFFDREKWDTIKNAYYTIKSQLEILPKWDKQSVLWSGNIKEL